MTGLGGMETRVEVPSVVRGVNVAATLALAAIGVTPKGDPVDTVELPA